MTKPRKRAKPSFKIQTAAGVEYRDAFELATLLRDAKTTIDEIEGEPDPQKRKERERDRDIARDELIRISRTPESYEQLSGPDRLVVKTFITNLKRREKRFPLRQGGRRAEEHKRLLL